MEEDPSYSPDAAPRAAKAARSIITEEAGGAKEAEAVRAVKVAKAASIGTRECSSYAKSGIPAVMSGYLVGLFAERGFRREYVNEFTRRTDE
jgi:hypothetical protein